MPGQSIVQAKAVPRGSWVIFMAGLVGAVCTRVKLPKQTRGRVTHHPGGSPSKVTAPSGHVEYDDLVVDHVLTSLPDTLYLWWRTVLDNTTGIGLPSEAVDQLIAVVQVTQALLPVKSWPMKVWPAEREWTDLEGGSDDPSTVTMTFAVSWMDEI